MTDIKQAILKVITFETNEVPRGQFKCPNCGQNQFHQTPYNREDHGQRVATCSVLGRLKYCPEYQLPNDDINTILILKKNGNIKKKRITMNQVKDYLKKTY